MTFRLSVVVALMSFVVAPVVHATVVVVPEFAELAQKSELIVHATVTAQDVIKSEGHVLTRTTLRVADGIKGAKAGDTLVVHQIGGTLDGHVTWIAGAHRFRVGEEMVLFGARWPKHGPTAIMPYGVGYGVFDVVEDPASGALVVREQIGDITTMARGADGKLTRSAPVARTWQSLDAFKDEVRGALAGPARDFKKPTRMTAGGRQ